MNRKEVELDTTREIRTLKEKLHHQKSQILRYKVLIVTYFLIAAISIIANIWRYGC